MSKITRQTIPQPCSICKIKNTESFVLEDTEKKTSVCSVCLSLTVPEKMNPESRVAFLPLKHDTTKVISLLLRALAHAKNSGNEEYVEKAEKIKALLEQTVNITLAEQDSDDVYDLTALVKENPAYFSLNQDNELFDSIKNDADGLPSVSEWKQIKNKMNRS